MTQEIEHRHVNLPRRIIILYERPGKIKVRTLRAKGRAGKDIISCSGQEITLL